MQSTFATTSLAATVREGGQIDVRPDPDFVARVVETRRRCDAGGDRDREEQERQEGGEPAAAREEPEEPAAGGEAKRGGRGGRGVAHVGMGARREVRRRIITKRRRPWRTWCDSWTRRWDCRPKTSS